MHSPGINGEGELRRQPANPGSPGKMAIKTEYVCVCVWVGGGQLVRWNKVQETSKSFSLAFF